MFSGKQKRIDQLEKENEELRIALTELLKTIDAVWPSILYCHRTHASDFAKLTEVLNEACRIKQKIRE